MSEPGRIIYPAEVMQIFKAAVDAAGSCRKFGSKVGVSGAYISALLRGNKPFTPRILATVGIEAHTVYRTVSKTDTV